jgi:hypothetical protein
LRLVQYGYRQDEVILPITGEIKANVIIKPLGHFDPNVRPVVKVSLGCHTVGSSLPHVDPSDMATVALGIRKRFVNKPPDHDKNLLRKLQLFVSHWCNDNLVPLPVDTDLTLDTWLESTAYSRGRINELKKKWQDVGGVLQKKHFKVRSFVKDESYPEFKHARLINARHDVFKCYVGPTFKCIEKELFKLPWFIKNIPVRDRPSYIKDYVGKLGSIYSITDYTAFESLFVGELMQNCEFVLYDYMTQNLPNHGEFMRTCNEILAGQNECISNMFKVTVEATRMSGEMCTSLGNSFANLMFMLFILHENGNVNPRGVVEGDDGIFSFDNSPPTSKQFEKLGLVIKLELVDDISKASFCGLVFDPVDLINIANPFKILCQTGFTTQEYAFSKSKVLRGLLKAKAFSLIYQYPGCPVISSFARYLLRNLEDDYVYFRKGHTDYTDILQKEAFTFWLRHKDVLTVETGMNTRILMEQVFGMSIDVQLQLEDFFDNLSCIKPIENQLLLSTMPESWIEFSDRFTRLAPLDPLSIRNFYC